ncbi:hypothetical protein HDC94_000167 [Leifsonia sp. AK011]|nr:hypothetical protein [Leifsonia sp. AK011]NYF09011.1 hypothetical protein [Leifsonia sp. AK011]
MTNTISDRTSTTPSGDPVTPDEVDPETGTDPDGTPTENPSG